jgi:biotin carboxyl carrier protein
VTSPFNRISELAALLAAAGLDELELVGPDGRVLLRRGADGAAAPVSVEDEAAEDAAFEVVASSGVGHFLHAHPLRAQPLVAPDDAVVAGQPLGLLRVGTLLLQATAPRDAVVARVVAADGALVGYGDPLVELWPEE